LPSIQRGIEDAVHGVCHVFTAHGPVAIYLLLAHYVPSHAQEIRAVDDKVKEINIRAVAAVVVISALMVFEASSLWV